MDHFSSVEEGIGVKACILVPKNIHADNHCQNKNCIKILHLLCAFLSSESNYCLFNLLHSYIVNVRTVLVGCEKIIFRAKGM